MEEAEETKDEILVETLNRSRAEIFVEEIAEEIMVDFVVEEKEIVTKIVAEEEETIAKIVIKKEVIEMMESGQPVERSTNMIMEEIVVFLCVLIHLVLFDCYVSACLLIGQCRVLPCRAPWRKFTCREHDAKMTPI